MPEILGMHSIQVRLLCPWTKHNGIASTFERLDW